MGDKRLYKSSENSMLCGVCGGIAEYFDIDPTLVRLAWVILTCFGGAGIWAYIIAATRFQFIELIIFSAASRVGNFSVVAKCFPITIMYSFSSVEVGNILNTSFMSLNSFSIFSNVWSENISLLWLFFFHYLIPPSLISFKMNDFN